MNVQSNLDEVRKSIKSGVKLVAVSKTKPVEAIQNAYDTGHRVFGENKAQELAAKYQELPKDIEWHFIGHLQSNKVKYIAPFVSLIHGVESIKLLKEINKQALKNNRVINCLLQFHIADETTKFGLSYEEAEELLKNPAFATFKNIRIVGVMGMATYSDDKNKITEEFRTLRQIFKKLKNEYFKAEDSFKEISMGMSGDYQIAMEEGSTMVRIGSAIFGARNYNI